MLPQRGVGLSSFPSRARCRVKIRCVHAPQSLSTASIRVAGMSLGPACQALVQKFELRVNPPWLVTLRSHLTFSSSIFTCTVGGTGQNSVGPCVKASWEPEYTVPMLLLLYLHIPMTTQRAGLAQRGRMKREESTGLSTSTHSVHPKCQALCQHNPRREGGSDTDPALQELGVQGLCS